MRPNSARVVFLLLVLLLAVASPALAIDADKQLHLAAGAILAGSLDTVLYHKATTLTTWDRSGIAFGMGGVLPAVGKEVLDVVRGGSADIQDIGYTLAGAACAVAVSEMTNSLFFVSAHDREVVVGVVGRWP